VTEELRLSIAGLASFVLAPADLAAEPAPAVPEDRPTHAGWPSPEVRAVPASSDDRAQAVRRFEVTVDGWTFVVVAEAEARALLRERAAQGRARLQTSDPVVVRAPMPGRIVRSWVTVGDTVEAGQRLLAIEAMKMENEVRSPRAGIVAGITVAAGSSVELGDELLTVR
jgi:biotin carboxyl carrier protein